MINQFPDSLRGRWARLMNWTPTDRQLRHFADRLVRAGSVASDVLNFLVIWAALYVGLEIALAFLPGGAVGRILGGR